MIERYSNPEISNVWSLENKYRIWLEIELAVCEAWNRRGLIPDEDLKNIKDKAAIDTKRILEIEETVQHDVIAFLTSLKEFIGPSGRYVHYGLTSSDIGDTALSLQMVRSADILLERLDSLINIVRRNAIRYKKTIMAGRTHGIHGEPTTLGLKFAHFYAELNRDRDRLREAKSQMTVGKFSGVVGTFSNIEPEMEEEICKILGLKADPITTQVINRDRHAYLISIIGIIAGGLERFAQEIRLLQKTEGREVEEPFASGQKGSSAMPHKRNPIICERICGMSRIIQSNVITAFRNMPLWHERDISHSSAERVILPDSMIAMEYILTKMMYVLENLHVYPDAMEKVLGITRGLMFSQRVLLALVDTGMEREEAYENVQRISMQVWNDQKLDFKMAIKGDPALNSIFNEKKLEEIFDLQYFIRNIDFIYKRLDLE